MSYVRGKQGSNFGDAWTDIAEAEGKTSGYELSTWGPQWDPVVSDTVKAASGQLSVPESGSYETEATYVEPDPETTIYPEKQPVAEPNKVATEQQEPPEMTDPAPPVGGGSALPVIAVAAVAAYLLVR